MIAVLTDPGVGGTFLTWTLHYLSGHDTYYSVSEQQFVPLINNPVGQHNAHKFKPNQPLNAESARATLDKLCAQPSKSFHTIYFHNFHDDTDFESVVQLTESAANKLVVLALTKSNLLYQVRFNRRSQVRSSFVSPNELVTGADEQYQDLLEHFFKHSRDQYGLGADSPVWEQREFLALSLNHYNQLSIVDYVDRTRAHYFLDSTELFNRFDCTVAQLFDYLELEIDQSRWPNWLSVYQNWQQLHVNSLQFMLYFDSIVEAIVNNHYMDLTRFKLDLVQEAAIQRELLYKHNLALKMWRLEKFVDTQQLHNLLEENIYHKL